MPTYEYTCDACNQSWELFQPMGSKAKTKCPECGARKARRLIGAGAGIIFKGSGFYETDYRSDSYKESAKADKDAQSSDSKSETKGKTESKAKVSKKNSSSKKGD